MMFSLRTNSSACSILRDSRLLILNRGQTNCVDNKITPRVLSRRYGTTNVSAHKGDNTRHGICSLMCKHDLHNKPGLNRILHNKTSHATISTHVHKHLANSDSLIQCAKSLTRYSTWNAGHSLSTIAHHLTYQSPYTTIQKRSMHSQVVVPGKVSEYRSVPSHIVKPPYIGNPSLASLRPPAEIKTEKQIEGMRDSGAIACAILQYAGLCYNKNSMY